jgi:signal transduction histidine kinase
MISATERELFDALHPFSFITDDQGIIQFVGRSLAKILSHFSHGQHFSKVFVLIQPSNKPLDVRPINLFGELVVLSSPLNDRIKLRGQVAPCGAGSPHCIFALELSISSPSDLSALNLTITDFRMADPIFDFLLFMQGQVLNQKRLREAKESLEWKNRITKLLLSIALSTQESDNEEAVYRAMLDSVCQAFGWDVGHVLLLAEDSPSELVSSGLWSMTECERYVAFYHDTTTRRFKQGEGLPGQVLEQRRVVWLRDVTQDPQFPRRGALTGLKHVTGAGVPIFVGESVVAVIEFFKAGANYDSAPIVRFFELLSLQLSAVVARQRAEMESRRHLAGLANASKMATLGEIAAGVAHEINNPLHTLTLTNHLLQRLSDGNRLTKELLHTHLEKVETCVQRMATIVSELKAFSRDSSQDKYKETPLRSLVSETLDLCHARLLSRDIRLDVSDIPDSWKAECRPSQLSQVILNLLNNAYDAALGQAERWVKLEVKDCGESFEIAVTDSGTGVPPEIAKKIMNPFFTTKPPGKGTGLGLSISSNIMTDHGGSLTLDRQSPHTRFVMSLPKKQRHGPRAGDERVAASVHEEPTGGDPWCV